MERELNRFRSAWLSNFGYNQAGIASERAQKKWGFLPTGEELDSIRQRLLDERFETERALRRLGITEFTLPKGIPGVGTIINETPLSHDHPVHVCVAGMPGAGKDTLLDKCRDLLVPHISVQPEAYTKIGQRKSFGRGPFWKMWIQREIRNLESMSDGIGEVDRKNLFDGFQVMEDGIVLLNRSFVDDPPWIWTYFLDGKFEAINHLDFVLSRLNSALVPDATFLCLVPPEISLARKLKPNESPRKILNSEFLRILYGQYLRYYEYLSRETDLPNLIILDMSGSIDDNFNLFKGKLEEIWGRWIF